MIAATPCEPRLLAKLVIALPLAARRWRGVPFPNRDSQWFSNES
jgi:hypothetical protein